MYIIRITLCICLLTFLPCFAQAGEITREEVEALYQKADSLMVQNPTEYLAFLDSYIDDAAQFSIEVTTVLPGQLPQVQTVTLSKADLLATERANQTGGAKVEMSKTTIADFAAQADGSAIVKTQVVGIVKMPMAGLDGKTQMGRLNIEGQGQETLIRTQKGIISKGGQAKTKSILQFDP